MGMLDGKVAIVTGAGNGVGRGDMGAIQLGPDKSHRGVGKAGIGEDGNDAQVDPGEREGPASVTGERRGRIGLTVYRRLAVPIEKRLPLLNLLEDQQDLVHFGQLASMRIDPDESLFRLGTNHHHVVIRGDDDLIRSHGVCDDFLV